MKDVSTMKKRLQQYSALASGLIAMASVNTEGQIVYTDVIPDKQICDPSCYENQFHLDLNNDGIFDFDILVHHFHSSIGSTIWGASSSTINSVKASAHNSNQIDANTINQ